MTAAPALTRSSLLVRNIGLSFAGQAVPILAAVVSVPILVRDLGVDRFGVLTIAWVVVGYFGVLDLGLGRALTQALAHRLGIDERFRGDEIIVAALLAMLGLSVIAALSVALVAPWLASEVLRVPAALVDETRRSFLWLALSVPFVITAAGLRGVLEAHQRFAAITAIRIPASMAVYLAPLAALPFTRNLGDIVAVLLAARIANWLALFLLVIGSGHRLWVAPEVAAIGRLLRYGLWTTTSSIAGIFLVTIDRFVISAVVSVGAVAYYATPFELASKVWFVSGAVATVMFPAFTTTAVDRPDRAAALYQRALLTVMPVMAVPLGIAVALAPDAMTIWLGPAFSSEAAPVLRLLAPAILFSGTVLMPVTLLQSLGRPGLLAKIQLAELPITLLLYMFATGEAGIRATAVAASVRAGIELVLFSWLATRVAPIASDAMRRTFVIIAASTVFILLPIAIAPTVARLAYSLVAATVLAAWMLRIVPMIVRR